MHWVPRTLYSAWGELKREVNPLLVTICKWLKHVTWCFCATDLSKYYSIVKSILQDNVSNQSRHWFIKKSFQEVDLPSMTARLCVDRKWERQIHRKPLVRHETVEERGAPVYLRGFQLIPSSITYLKINKFI